MKQFSMIVGIFFLVATISLTSCKGEAEKKETKSEQVADKGEEYTSDYVCPMHCEGSGSDAEGNCPKCGMAYVANEDHKTDGHKH